MLWYIWWGWNNFFKKRKKEKKINIFFKKFDINIDRTENANAYDKIYDM